MFHRLIALVVIVGGAALSGAAAAGADPVPVRYDNHKLVRVHLENEAQLATMLSISGDCWNEAIGVGELDFRVRPEAMARLERSGIRFEVLNDNLQLAVDAERARLARQGEAGPDGLDWYDDFKDFNDVVARLNTWAVAYPDLVELVDIGDSLQGRDIWALRISGTGADKPAVLYNSCQHAREWISPMVTMYIAEALIEGYGVDPEITGLLDSVEFFVIPVVNPDGYVYSWDVERYWRKNRRDNGDGTFGVDNNRNWGYEWGGEGSSGDTSSSTYRGTAPFSEPETQAMRDFYIANPSIVASIDFHAHGEQCLYPWAYQYAEPDDGGLHNFIGDAMVDAIAAVHGHYYELGPVSLVLYLAAGGSVDWTWGDQGVISYTIELRGPDFVLPPTEIIPTCEENLEAALTLAEAATVGVLYSFPFGLPEIVEADTTGPVAVVITPIASGPLDETSGRLYSRTGSSGPFAESAMSYEGGNEYLATLPGIPCGQTLEYYFEIESDSGTVYRSPRTAPDAVHSALSLQITVSFEDDFENDLGWDVEDSGGLTDGTWDRGVPVGGGDRGDPPTDADGSGQCYLTDNVDDNSDVDGGTTTLYSPIMDATDPDASISYYRWYSNNFGADPYNDIFVVDVSDDGGSSWVNLETVGPGGSEVQGGWYYKEFPIADIPGITGTTEFRIRFAASDLADGSVVEAGVDGVAIRSFSCDDVTGDVTGDGVVDILDLLAVLGAWGPCEGCPEDIDGNGTVDILDLLAVLANWT